MTTNVHSRAFQAALDAANDYACDNLETQLQAGITAYLEVLHIHVMEETPSDVYELSAAEADNLFKPKTFEIDE